MAFRKNKISCIRRETRLKIYCRDQFRCIYCSQKFDSTQLHLMSLDHVIARADGGSNRPSNLVTCCKRHNDSRKHLKLRRWLRKYFFERVQPSDAHREMGVSTEARCKHYVDTMMRLVRNAQRRKLPKRVPLLFSQVREAARILYDAGCHPTDHYTV